MSEDEHGPESGPKPSGPESGPEGSNGKPTDQKAYAKHDQNTVSRKMRQEEVVRLRMLGWSFDEIAAECGFASKSGAHSAFEAAIANFKTPMADELRGMLVTGWLQVWRANLPIATGQPDDTGKPTCEPQKDAVDSLSKASARIEAITGLAIKRVEVTGKDGAPLVPTDLSKLSDDELEAIARGAGSG